MNKLSDVKYSNYLSWDEYINSMSENKENFKRITNKVLKDKKLNNSVKKLNEKLKNKELIVLTEDFCPDSLFNIPILILIAEKLELVTLKIYRRSENKDLNELFITNELRKIPAILILDKNKIQYKWEEKPKKAYAIQLDLKNELSKNSKLNDIEKKNSYLNSSEYEYRKHLWEETVNEIYSLKEL